MRNLIYELADGTVVRTYKEALASECRNGKSHSL